MSRDGRRRRVLNDEVLGHAILSVTRGASDDVDAPRFGDGASIEHHPQVSDFVPRKRRTVLLLTATTLAAAAATAAAVRFADKAATALPGMSEAGIDSQVGRLVAWTSSTLLLTSMLAARLIHSLRKHRVADVNGQYRVWKWVERGCLAMSLFAVAPLHATFARMAAAATGWSLTKSAAEWWMAPLGLVVAWMALRFIREVSECRGALAWSVAGTGLLGASAAIALGWSPSQLQAWSGGVATALPLATSTIILATLLTYARYVVLDVQGLIDHAPSRPSRTRDTANDGHAATVPLTTTTKTSSPAGGQVASAVGDDADEDEESDGRYLSKAERKRLRKQQRSQAA